MSSIFCRRPEDVTTLPYNIFFCDKYLKIKFKRILSVIYKY